MSRLLERLDAQIAQAEEVFERECLKSRRAAVLARHGQFSEARFALQGLRSQSQRLRNPVLSAWVAFVDGLIEHCESLSPSARAKFQRAYDLASTAGDAELHSLCAAWLAIADFNANDIDATVAHAKEALRSAPATAHAARARAALVVASAWRVAGDDERAIPWYKVARQHAATEGDVSLRARSGCSEPVGGIKSVAAGWSETGRGDDTGVMTLERRYEPVPTTR